MLTSAQIASKYGGTVSVTSPSPAAFSGTATTAEQIASKYGGSIEAAPKADIFAGTKSTFSGLIDDPLSLKADPTKVVSSAWDSIKGAVTQEATNIHDLFTSPDIVSGIGNTLKTVAGGANVLFSPISALFTGAEQIPVLGSVSKLISTVFSGAGEGAAGISNAIVDAMPFPQDAKDKIKPGLGEVSALAAQLALGRVIPLGKKKALEDTYGKEDAATILKKADEVATQHKTTAFTSDQIAEKYGGVTAQTPEEAHAAYAKATGYEPYTNPKTLPTIDAGAFAKDTSGLPTIKADAPAIKSDLTYEPIRTVGAPAAPAVEAIPNVKVPESTSAAAPNGTYVAPATETPIAGEKASGFAQSIQEKAIKDNILQSRGDVTTFEGSSLEEQARLISKHFAESTPQDVLDVLNGRKPLPEGIKPGPYADSISLYAKEIAKTDPNMAAELAYRVANSIHAKYTSEGASNLSLLQNRDKGGYLAKTEYIVKAREDRAGEQAIKQAKSIPKEAAKAMKEVNLSKKDLGKLSDFIDKITC
jgi:hypothetical protein